MSTVTTRWDIAVALARAAWEEDWDWYKAYIKLFGNMAYHAQAVAHRQLYGDDQEEEHDGAAEMTQCIDCEGTGVVANTEEREPWYRWMELPAAAQLAVRAAIVKPMWCPECQGTGRKGEP